FRKASADGNVRQKTPTRRPSASSLKARTNTMQQRVRTEKSSSNQNVSQGEPKEQPQNAADAFTPKMRFTAQDRGKDFVSPSPRLKYFPAEKIKRLDSSPAYTPDPIGAIIMQQNPQESGTFFVPGSVDQNNGQGDANAALQSVSQPRQHQTMHTMSQQQVGGHQPVHQMGQINPCSDPTLHQQVQANQMHRPCVPHGQREPSPQKTPQSLYRTGTPQPMYRAAISQPSNPMPPPSPAVPSPPKPEEGKVENNGTECPDYEGQPVGGRNAAMYRQVMIASQQPQAQSQMSMMPNVSQSNSSQQYQQPAQNHYQAARQPNPQNPQVSYQQLQQTAAQQQQLQQRALAYQAQMANNSPQKNQAGAPVMGQGMVSPQEANKYRAMQHYQAQRTNYAMNPQSGQLNPYTINVANNQPQLVPPNVQQHPMQQYQSQSAQPFQNSGQQQYRNPAGYYVGNSGHQLQKNPAENVNQQPLSSQKAEQPPAQSPVNQDNQEKKAKLSFTPSMIRDQEKLVATMKQQGVPFDIIKRQFEALLNEQRRQLEYIEELRRQDYLPEVERPVAVTRRPKQTDEKPEWMVHLTPKRLSYVEVERMYEKQKQKEQMTRQMDQSRENEMVNQIYQHSQQQQQYQYYPQDNQQQPNQQPQQMFAQPRMLGWAQSTPNVTTINHPQSFPSHQQEQHAYAQQQYPQLHLYQQVYPVNRQQVERESPNNPATHETVKRTTEPSSLLKLRVYKDCIRPQGRNNGLQDPQIVRKYLEQSSNSAEVQRGLEYLASLGAKKQMNKLNGMQEHMEVEHQLNERLAAASNQQSSKRVSANGLENTRNPNNPPSQRLTQLKKSNQEFLREYPRQKQANSQECYVVQAERENGTVAPVEQNPYMQQHSGHTVSTPMIPYNDRNPATAGNNLMPYRFDGNNPQYYQQMQQYYQNARNLAKNTGEGDMGFVRKNDVSKNSGFDRAGGDATGNMNGQTPDSKISMYRTHHSQPDLYEARSIGGVRYLARKQDYMPNTQLVSPETLIASRHLQPPMIY
ncbi:uncharacterized protein LOC144478285, partial [Augochlora pura]